MSGTGNRYRRYSCCIAKAFHGLRVSGANGLPQNKCAVAALIEISIKVISNTVTKLIVRDLDLGIRSRSRIHRGHDLINDTEICIRSFPPCRTCLKLVKAHYEYAARRKHITVAEEIELRITVHKDPYHISYFIIRKVTVFRRSDNGMIKINAQIGIPRKGCLTSCIQIIIQLLLIS